MSAYGELDTRPDSPIPVTSPVQGDDLVSPNFSAADVFCAIVVAVEFIAAVGGVVYLLAF